MIIELVLSPIMNPFSRAKYLHKYSIIYLQQTEVNTNKTLPTKVLHRIKLVEIRRANVFC